MGCVCVHVVHDRVVMLFSLASVIDFIKKMLAVLCVVRDLNSLARDQTHTPLQWKCRVLTTGPPGKSPIVWGKKTETQATFWI